MDVNEVSTTGTSSEPFNSDNVESTIMAPTVWSTVFNQEPTGHLIAKNQPISSANRAVPTTFKKFPGSKNAGNTITTGPLKPTTHTDIVTSREKDNLSSTHALKPLSWTNRFTSRGKDNLTPTGALKLVSRTDIFTPRVKNVSMPMSITKSLLFTHPALVGKKPEPTPVHSVAKAINTASESQFKSSTIQSKTTTQPTGCGGITADVTETTPSVQQSVVSSIERVIQTQGQPTLIDVTKRQQESGRNKIKTGTKGH